jgi:hypothetical protein
MKKPILGEQTFLTRNTERILSFENYVREVYDRPADKPLYTGRYFVVLREGVRSFAGTKKLFESQLGLTVAHSNDFRSQAIDDAGIQDAQALIYDDLGIALIGGDDDQMQILESTHADYIVVPEKIVYVPDEAPAALNIPGAWGLAITMVTHSQFTGSNVKVAVLDTGFDVDHPDFADRNITSQSETAAKLTL